MSPSSTTIFHFLLRKAFETFQVYYTILIIAFEFVFNLKHILSSSVTIFQMACLQVSSQQIFSVTKLYYVILQSFFCIQLFSTFFMVQVVQGPGFYGPCFSGSMLFMAHVFQGSDFFRVQVFLGQGLLSFRSSPTLVKIISYVKEEKM